MRPTLGTWNKNRCPVIGKWQGQTRTVAHLLQCPEGLRLESTISSINPTMPFLNETEALIWMEEYLRNPDGYTKEDAIMEILDRWGDQDWLTGDIEEANGDSGFHLRVHVTKDYPESDPLPRVLGPGFQRVFLVVMQKIR